MEQFNSLQEPPQVREYITRGLQAGLSKDSCYSRDMSEDFHSRIRLIEGMQNLADITQIIINNSTSLEAWEKEYINLQISNNSSE